MKLRCLHEHYSGRGIVVNRGDVFDASAEIASALLHDFPKWFEAVDEQPAAKAENEEAPAKVAAAKRNKQYKSKRTK